MKMCSHQDGTCLRVVSLVISSGILLYMLVGDVFIGQQLTWKTEPTFRLDRAKAQKNMPMIVLTAYQHGGSSIVASLIGQHPDTLYFYEPLDAMYMSTFSVPRWRYMIDVNFYNNGSVRPLYAIEKQMTQHCLQRISHCDLNSLPPEMCQLIGQMDGALFKEECEPKCSLQYNKTFSLELIKSSNSIGFDEGRGYDKHRCYSSARTTMLGYSHICEDSHFLTLKILRYEMGQIIDILENTKNMFLLHLIRDPRGIINSFIRRKVVTSNPDIEVLSAKICNGMRQHLKIIRAANLSMGDRIKVLRYEDFAKCPVRFTKGLYKLMSLDVPDTVWRWLQRVSQPTGDHGKFLRRNASQTAFAWKLELTEEHMHIIDGQCSPLYRLFEDV